MVRLKRTICTKEICKFFFLPVATASPVATVALPRLIISLVAFPLSFSPVVVLILPAIITSAGLGGLLLVTYASAPVALLAALASVFIFHNNKVFRTATSKMPI
jgi:hypothetical protein